LSIHRTPRSACASALALALCLSACSSADESSLERIIGPPRRIETQAPPPRLFVASAERFGLSTAAPAQNAQFSYATPSGWSERESTEMRVLNFQIDDAGKSECYVTVLGGDGGGDLANVNRWCGQIGVKVWDSAQLDSAPRIRMFGAEALLVALGDPSAARALLCAMARLDSRAVFVKLSGSAEEVAAQRAAFELFCKSLALKP
jgi:hypothetical protein